VTNLKLKISPSMIKQNIPKKNLVKFLFLKKGRMILILLSVLNLFFLILNIYRKFL